LFTTIWGCEVMEKLCQKVQKAYEKYKEVRVDQKKLLNALSKLTGKHFETPEEISFIDVEKESELRLRALYASLIYKIYEAWNVNRAISMQIMGYNADRKFRGDATIEKDVEELVDKYLGIRR